MDADALTDFDSRLLQAKLEALAEFAAGAGHEINNPLAIISGRVQLLLRDEAHPDRRRDLALIHAQAMRVHEMIGDLMLFARPPELCTQVCDVAAWIESLGAELQPQAESQGVAFQAAANPATGLFHFDPVQLAVAVHALVTNAIQACDRQGRVDLTASVEADSGALLIRVRDTGPGISPEAREHLFDPFYSGRAAGRGIGMGLPKAWRMVTQHGGTLTARNGELSGAEFTIQLPSTTRGSATNAC